MGLKLLDHGSAEYKQMVQLRFQILRQPLGLTFTQEELDVEKDDILIAAFDEEEILVVVCCAKWMSIGCVCVRWRYYLIVK